MNIKKLTPGMLAMLTISLLASCASFPTTKVDSKSEAVIQAMSDKLAAAKTVRVNLNRTASPGFYTGLVVPKKSSGTVVVQRPGKLAAKMNTSEGARLIGFDGRNLTVVDRVSGTHTVAKATGDIDQAVRGIKSTYGVTPPLGGLLANDPRSVLLGPVKTGKYIGTETIDGVECDHMAFTEEYLTWQIWVATGDKLPRRVSYTYPNGEGGDPLIMTAVIAKWQLDVPVAASELAVKPPAGSRALKRIPIQP